MRHRRLLLKNGLIKVSSCMMWCNFVDMKPKQGFLEYKHTGLNIWKAVLVLDGLSCVWLWTCWWIQLGWAPLNSSVFRLLSVLFLFELFYSQELQSSYLAVLSLLFWFNCLIWAVLCCVAVLRIGWISRALTVPAECNRISVCCLCLPSHVGTVHVALATPTGQFITHYTFALEAHPQGIDFYLSWYIHLDTYYHRG